METERNEATVGTAHNVLANYGLQPKNEKLKIFDPVACERYTQPPNATGGNGGYTIGLGYTNLHLSGCEKMSDLSE